MLPTTLQIASVGWPLRFISRKRRQRIGRFAALRDGKQQRAIFHGRIAVTQFARIFHFHWNAGQLLNQIFAYQGRVPTRATSGENDSIHVPQIAAASRFSPPKTAVASSSLMRPRMAFSSESGCSKISLSM